MREHSAGGSLRKERTVAKSPVPTSVGANANPLGLDEAVLLRPSGYHNDPSDASHETQRLLASPAISVSGSYASTTDEDDGMSFYRPSSSGSSFKHHTTGTKSLSRRRSNRSERRASLTAAPIAPDLDMDDEWDYSETEWWGWVVLIATWVVFVVGMGSCLGIWGWAWDVGETPYAPPDLEDDATLPITGYYPALMVCTAVMAWVWVVVAWVGMKYFRHAKVGVDG